MFKLRTIVEDYEARSQPVDGALREYTRMAKRSASDSAIAIDLAYFPTEILFSCSKIHPPPYKGAYGKEQT